jgi:hypothetical protein
MQYMVSVIVDSQTTDESTDALATAKEMADIDVFNQRLIDEGYWVFAGGLAAPTTSTVIDSRGTQPIFTDGPRSGWPGCGSGRRPTWTSP